MGNGYDHDHWMSGQMGGSPGWGGWLVLGVVLLLCLAFAATLVVWVVRSTARPPVEPAAKSVLDDRFARGEIDEEEYLLRRRVLHPGSGGIG